MRTYTIYIGSNNETKRLELDRIREIVTRRHKGFTLYTATGYWLGSAEDTAVLIIFDTWSSIIRTLSDLKIDLEQDAIGYQESPEMVFA
jgi:hypothetical protein